MIVQANENISDSLGIFSDKLALEVFELEDNRANELIEKGFVTKIKDAKKSATTSKKGLPDDAI